MALGFLVVWASATVVFAAKPGGGGGGGGDSLGPVTPAYNFALFEDRYADLGGVLDTSTGLVWGYEPPGWTNAGYAWIPDANVTERYLVDLQIGADGSYAAGDTASGDKFQAAHDLAAQFAWRLPTLEEARDASAKGLFTFGNDGCNKYLSTPISTVPGMYGGAYHTRWTSTTAKWRGIASAWAWAPGDGGALLVSKTSSITWLPVRTHPAP